MMRRTITCSMFALILSSACSGNSLAAERKEFSGIVMSRQYSGIFWTHSDSGGRPEIFAIRVKGGRVATVKIRGAKNIDWEDMTIDDQGYLYICDIGNNLNLRKNFVIYRLKEPNPFTETFVSVLHQFEYRYPDQSRFPNPRYLNFDAEACFWKDESLYILTKHRSDRRTKLYRLSLENDATMQPLMLISEHEIGGQVTAAEFSPDGDRLAVLTYDKVHLFDQLDGHENYLMGPHDEISIRFDQAEGISFDGNTVVIINEKEEVLQIPLY
jgi:WD40 repeat protein